MSVKPLHPLVGKVVILEYVRGESDEDRVRSICLPYGLKYGKLEPFMNVFEFPKRLVDWDTDRLYDSLVRFLRQEGVGTVYAPTWAPEVCGIGLGRIAQDDEGNRWSDVDTLDLGDWRVIRLVLDGFTVHRFDTNRGQIIPD